MSNTKRKICIIAAVLPAVLLLTAAGVLFFRYLPGYWLENIQNSYLQPQRGLLRAGEVKAGAFKTLQLKDVELGKAGEEIFKAPEAELRFDFDFRNSIKNARITELHLKKSHLVVDSAAGKIRLNGIILQDMVKVLSALPPAPDGRYIPLTIEASFSIGKAQPSSRIELTVVRDHSSKLSIAGRIFPIGEKKSAGSWSAVIDQNNNCLSFDHSGNIPTIFLQEILLRAKLPLRAISVLQGADFSGRGNFSASYPELAIREFEFSGKLAPQCLRFYKYDFKQIEPFEISLQKNKSRFICRIPEFTSKDHGNVHLQNIELKYSPRRPVITLDAQCNIQQTLLNMLMPSGKKGSGSLQKNFPDKIHGSWNLQSNKWQIVSQERAILPKEALKLNLPQIKVLLQPEKFTFKAYGSGSSGTAVHDLHFNALEIYALPKNNTIKSSSGYLNAMSHFGMADRPDQHLLHYNFKELTAVSSSGEIAIPEISGKIDLRPTEDEKIDIFVSAATPGIRIITPHWNADIANGRFAAELNTLANFKKINIRSLDLKADKFIFDHQKQVSRLAGFSMLGKAMVENWQLSQAGVQLQADELISGKDDLKTLSAAIEWDNKNTSGKLRGTASANTARINIVPGLTTEILKCSAKFSGNTLTQLPGSIVFEADSLQAAKQFFNAHFSRSKWQFNKISPQEWNINSSFESVQYNTLRGEFGNGTSGLGSLSANIIFSDTSADDFKVELLADMAQFSTQYGNFHTGSENMQGALLYQIGRQPLAQCNLTLNKANVLGRCFSATVPQLNVEFTAEKKDHIAGIIKFDNAAISDVQGHLELRQAKLTLPFLAAAKEPTRLKSGSFSAGEVIYKGIKEGKITAGIEHFFLLPENLTTSGRHQLKLSGKMTLANFNNAPARLEASWQLPPNEDTLQWSWNLPEAKLAVPLDLKKYLPLPFAATALRGSFIIESSGTVRDNSPTQKNIKLHSINSDWQIGNITAEGVTADTVMAFNDENMLIRPHDISIGKLHWQNWLTSDNEVNLSCSSNDLLISGWSGRLLGGSFSLTQAIKQQLPLKKNNSNMQFTVQDLPLDNFFSQLGVNCIKSHAKLNGSLSAMTAGSDLIIKQSKLKFNSPSGELLAIELKNTSVIRIRDTQYRNFALAILRAMKCTRSDFAITTTSGEVNMQLKAEGTPAAPVPFVYQGRRAATPFRPALPGEQGFDGEIELNVNLKLHPEKPGA